MNRDFFWIRCLDVPVSAMGLLKGAVEDAFGPIIRDYAPFKYPVTPDLRDLRFDLALPAKARYKQRLIVDLWEFSSMDIQVACSDTPWYATCRRYFHKSTDDNCPKMKKEPRKEQKADEEKSDKEKGDGGGDGEKRVEKEKDKEREDKGREKEKEEGEKGQKGDGKEQKDQEKAAAEKTVEKNTEPSRENGQEENGGGRNKGKERASKDRGKGKGEEQGEGIKKEED
ncbi:hypothetical protein CBR_g28489 [Chara braunii]|uniref:Uncharacterized protein n=1 Tax=Chara braunii TaxID=69332 RepID=A0A388JW81_CHABU|nr:hypothetical protein CBR_g28489 [Chara braunii]|eukprot:GBG62013.1 hypothetical protein CBR_g28489 [Chara braunii]